MVSRNIGFRFSLVSYNILSQNYLHDYSHLYAECNPKDLEWPRRGHRIVTRLLDNPADIICLQEVQSDHLNTLFRPRLEVYGYNCLYKKKTGYKIDGCAIFYQTKSFTLSRYKEIEFNRSDVNHLLNRDNVGIIAVLEPKSRCPLESSHLVVANTHLLFNPKRGDTKLAQLKLLLSELEEISLYSDKGTDDEPCHRPTILCGDLNSGPGSEVNRLITKNYSIDSIAPRKEIEDTFHSSSPIRRRDSRSPTRNTSISENSTSLLELMKGANHTFKFKSVHPTNDTRGQAYVSCFANRLVDYIFYTPKLTLESYLELLTQVEMTDNMPLPNSRYPSDHLALEACFRIK